MSNLNLTIIIIYVILTMLDSNRDVKMEYYFIKKKKRYIVGERGKKTRDLGDIQCWLTINYITF